MARLTALAKRPSRGEVGRSLAGEERRVEVRGKRPRGEKGKPRRGREKIRPRQTVKTPSIYLRSFGLIL